MAATAPSPQTTPTTIPAIAPPDRPPPLFLFSDAFALAPEVEVAELEAAVWVTESVTVAVAVLPAALLSPVELVPPAELLLACAFVGEVVFEGPPVVSLEAVGEGDAVLAGDVVSGEEELVAVAVDDWVSAFEVAEDAPATAVVTSSPSWNTL